MSAGALGAECKRDWPSLQGPHNLQNAVAACGVGAVLGLEIEQIEAGLRTYPGLPHRMERIRDRDGVFSSTTARRPMPRRRRRRWRLIQGTVDFGRAGQGGDAGRYREASRPCRRGLHHRRGGADVRAAAARGGGRVIECETLENAVERAAEDSQSGETVLLSPASASFDQFGISRRAGTGSANWWGRYERRTFRPGSRPRLRSPILAVTAAPTARRRAAGFGRWTASCCCW